MAELIKFSMFHFFNGGIHRAKFTILWNDLSYPAFLLRIVSKIEVFSFRDLDHIFR